MESIENLEAARNCLKTSLKKSSAIASALSESGSRLEKLHLRCQPLGSMSMQKCSFLDIGDHIDSVLCSAAAVLNVFESVRQLQKSLLTSPSSDPCMFVSHTKKLEEALKLLTDNCRLALSWLQGIFEFLQDKAISSERYVLNVRKSMRILRELEVMEEGARLDGGFLSTAFDKLRIEFHRLLIANTKPLSLVGQNASITTQGLPDSVTENLQAIVERLSANDRLHQCQSVYVEVRGMNAQKSMHTLDLSYLEIPTDEFEDLDVIENYIEQWGRHLELAVNYLLELEFRLSGYVFEKTSPEARMECFAKIAVESGILAFLQFGRNVSGSKNNPFKLLKLLHIFQVLNDLRPKFNQLFNAKPCEEIRTATKNLIKRVVDDVSEIFWQLPAQVKLLRPGSPPKDGSVPRLVSFVTDYCNQLLGDTHRPHLIQVLEIHLSWRNEIYEEGMVFTHIYNIMKEVSINLDAWSTAYEDITLSYLFMMNNHSHFHSLRGTAIGNLMGDSWLTAHEEYRDYYAALYLREILMVQNDLFSSSVSVTDQDLVQRLKALNLAFDQMYKKQSGRAITDEVLKENICKHLVECIVPTYRAYVQTSSLPIENDAKHIKYSVQNLENKIRSVFQPKYYMSEQDKKT